MRYLDRPMVFGGEENTDFRHEKITLCEINQFTINEVNEMTKLIQLKCTNLFNR